MTHTCTSGCGKDYDCPFCPHGMLNNEQFCGICDKPSTALTNEEYFKEWYLKRFISLKEYLRLTGLPL